MRQIGTLKKETDAHRFASYLLTQGMTAHAEQDSDGWAIWVREENHVDSARGALEDFRHNSDAPRYRGVEQTADTIRRQEEKQREMARKNVIEMRGRWGRVGAGWRPLVLTLIALCIFVGMTSNMGNDDRSRVRNTLLFCDPSHGNDPSWQKNTLQGNLIDIRQGQLWRLVTPIFVHYGVMHLAFNMIMFYQLGSLVEDRRGTWRIGLIILAVAVISNSVQSLVPQQWDGSPFGAGMSGVLYGLFGYIWVKMSYEPELQLFISRSAVLILTAWLFLGIFGVLEHFFHLHVANWTHGVGFLVGVGIGYAPQLFKPRRAG